MRVAILFLILVVVGIDFLPAQQPPSDPATRKAIAQIEESGGVVVPLAQNDPRLVVNLGLADGPVSNQALAALNVLKDHLADLNLADTSIGDAGVRQVAGLSGLIKLHLEKTAITDAALAHLSGLENLAYLNLHSTAVSDAGLTHLQGLRSLERLYVWNTQVTEAGAAELKKALPNLEINLGWELPEALPKAADDPGK